MSFGSKVIVMGVVALGFAFYTGTKEDTKGKQTTLMSHTETITTGIQTPSLRTLAQSKASSTQKIKSTPILFDSNKDTDSKPIELSEFIDQDITQIREFPSISINVEGRKYKVTRTSMKAKSQNNFTWTGIIEGQKKDSILIMTEVNGIYSGSIKTDSGFYTVNYDEKTEGYKMMKINRHHYGNDALHHEDFHSEEEPRSASGGAGINAILNAVRVQGNTQDTATQSNTNTASDHIVDIMVLYASDTFSTAAGENSIIAKIQNGVELVNQAYTRSDVNVQLRLVLTKKSSYVSSGSTQTDVARLYKKDNYIDEALTLRNQYGADLVSVVTTSRNNNIIGTAYFPGHSATAGHSAINKDYVETPMFAHELGHNFGLAHQTGGAGSYAYGRPHQFGTEKWTTIMWSHYQSSRHLFNYSNPNIQHQGMATGTSGKDGARATRNKASYIVNLRATKVISQEPQITSLSSNKSAVIGDTIELQVVASGNNLNYQWKRNGSNLSDSNSVSGSKSASLMIQNIQEAQAGDYQVEVSNSYGSVLSNVVKVSVGQLQAPIAQAGADQNVFTGQSVTLDGSQSSDPQGYNLSYSWAQISGPTVNLSNANSSRASFIAAAKGTYEFRLTISNGTLSSQDTVQVTAEEQNIGSLALNTVLTKQSRSSSKYEISLSGTAADINKVYRVFYHYYRTDGTFAHTQGSTNKKKNFLIKKTIGLDYLIKAEVIMTDGSTIYLNGRIDK